MQSAAELGACSGSRHRGCPVLARARRHRRWSAAYVGPPARGVERSAASAASPRRWARSHEAGVTRAAPAMSDAVGWRRRWPSVRLPLATRCR